MLRTLQKQRLLKMLRPGDPPFKILILDSSTQEILSPILRVSDLRDAGVTAHFLISNARSQIKDVPAFYFISSTELLVGDLEKDMYALYYLNSSSSFKRSELESIADMASGKQIALKIQSVCDQFLQFVSLQEDLFTLNISNSFINRNEPECLRSATMGLFSVFATLNEMPFIVSGSTEIGKMLEQKIKNTKIIKPGVKKPLLIIANRDFDVVTPTRHVMGYVELLHDIFNIKLNKVGNINLDTDSEFFKSNYFSDFPVVAEIVEKDLHNYKKELALRSLTDKSDKSEIQAALENAPHLQKKGEIINSNLNICVKILEEVKKRKLDDFYRMEENFDQSEIMELSTKGNDNDIMRLCISLLNSKNADLVGPILQKRNMSDAVISYFRQEIKNEDGFRSKVKKLIFKKNLPIYTFVEDVLGQIRNQSFQDLTHDPGHTGIFLSEISTIFVYIHGGATYLELKALKELEKIYKVPVILGGSEILNADEMLKQIGLEQQQ